MIRSLCGNIPVMAPQGLVLTLGTFEPDPSGVGGTLVLYLNGQAFAVWDAKDKNGKFVPSSFYHLIVEQTFTDGSKALREKSVFINCHNPVPGVLLSALPNFAQPGDTILITVMFNGTPGDDRSKVKIYNTGGELVRKLTLSNGTAAWNLTNEQGQAAASGVYLLVLDGVEVNTGNPARKIIKVMIQR